MDLCLEAITMMAPPSALDRYLIIELITGNVLYVNESTIISELWEEIQQRYRLIPSPILSIFDKEFSLRETNRAKESINEIIPIIGEECWENYRMKFLNHGLIDSPSTWLIPQHSPSIRQSLNWLCSLICAANCFDTEGKLIFLNLNIHENYQFSVSQNPLDTVIPPISKLILNSKVKHFLSADVFENCVENSNEDEHFIINAWTRPEDHVNLSCIKNLIGEFYLKPINVVNDLELNSNLSERLQKLYTDRNNMHSLSRVGHGKGIIENFDILRDLVEQSMYSNAWSFRTNFLPSLISPAVQSVLDETKAILTLLDPELWSN